MPLTDEQWATFSSLLETRSCKKHDFLLREGETCDHIYFAAEGVLRTFYMDAKGNEA